MDSSEDAQQQAAVFRGAQVAARLEALPPNANEAVSAISEASSCAEAWHAEAFLAAHGLEPPRTVARLATALLRHCSSQEAALETVLALVGRLLAACERGLSSGHASARACADGLLAVSVAAADAGTPSFCPSALAAAFGAFTRLCCSDIGLPLESCASEACRSLARIAGAAAARLGTPAGEQERDSRLCLFAAQGALKLAAQSRGGGAALPAFLEAAVAVRTAGGLADASVRLSGCIYRCLEGADAAQLPALLASLTTHTRADTAPSAAAHRLATLVEAVFARIATHHSAGARLAALPLLPWAWREAATRCGPELLPLGEDAPLLSALRAAAASALAAAAADAAQQPEAWAAAQAALLRGVLQEPPLARELAADAWASLAHACPPLARASAQLLTQLLHAACEQGEGEAAQARLARALCRLLEASPDEEEVAAAFAQLAATESVAAAAVLAAGFPLWRLPPRLRAQAEEGLPCRLAALLAAAAGAAPPAGREARRLRAAADMLRALLPTLPRGGRVGAEAAAACARLALCRRDWAAAGACAAALAASDSAMLAAAALPGDLEESEARALAEELLGSASAPRAALPLLMAAQLPPNLRARLSLAALAQPGWAAAAAATGVLRGLAAQTPGGFKDLSQAGLFPAEGAAAIKRTIKRSLVEGWQAQTWDALQAGQGEAQCLQADCRLLAGAA